MKLAIAMISLAFASVAGTAQAATAQQTKMKECNATAGEKALKGDERKAFMKECLSADKPAANGAASADCEKKAVSKEGKPLAGAAKSSFMKKCVAEAK